MATAVSLTPNSIINRYKNSKDGLRNASLSQHVACTAALFVPSPLPAPRVGRVRCNRTSTNALLHGVITADRYTEEQPSLATSQYYGLRRDQPMLHNYAYGVKHGCQSQFQCCMSGNKPVQFLTTILLHEPVPKPQSAWTGSLSHVGARLVAFFCYNTRLLVSLIIESDVWSLVLASICRML